MFILVMVNGLIIRVNKYKNDLTEKYLLVNLY